MFKSKRSVFCLAILLVVSTMGLAQRSTQGAPRATPPIAAPTITSISPTSIAGGGPAFTLTAVGTNFVRGAVVTWNGATLSTDYVSSTQLTAAVPNNLIAAAGTAQIAVYIPGRRGGISNSLPLTISAPPTTTTGTSTTTTPLAITTASVPGGTAGTAYSATLTASGGTTPYSWTVSSGALPAGLSMSSAGAISGTPTTSGSSSFVATVKDAASGSSSYTYSMSIAASSVSITTASVPNGTVGTAYRITIFAATGGTSPYTWSVATGSTLPAGLALSTAGALSGTPTMAATQAFSVQVKDSASNTATKSYIMTVTPPTTTRTTTGPIIPSTLFGMTVTSTSDWPSVPVGALGKGSSVVWPYVERSKGVFNWSNLDAWVNVAQSGAVTFFFSPESVPLWAAADPGSCAPNYPGSSLLKCTSMVNNIQDWDDYVTALVTRYKGRIQIYELWNEPNIFFTGAMADLVTLTTHMYNIIRSIDPAAFILSPSPSTAGIGSYIDSFFAAGGPTGVDGISFHTYTATPEKLIGYVNTMKQVASKYGLASKPLWDTEGSWGTASLTSDAQVAAVARFYLLQWSNGVSRFYWYAWDNSTWGTLWDSTNGLHPAGLAYLQVYDWMVGATMTSPCSVDATSTWTCGLRRPGGYQAQAIWNTASSLSYTAPSKFIRYSDLAGNILPITGGSVMIGPTPILLETSAP